MGAKSQGLDGMLQSGQALPEVSKVQPREVKEALLKGFYKGSEGVLSGF